MVYILHLPVFPNGSTINPDALNDLIIDEQSSDLVAHIVLNTGDEQKAISWAMEFLAANPQIQQDEVTLTSAGNLMGIMDIRGFFNYIPFQGSERVEAFYQERRKVAQQVIELPVHC